MLQKDVEFLIDNIVSTSVIKPTAFLFLEWTSSIILVLKKIALVKIWGDFKQTLKLTLLIDKYLIPNKDDEEF